MRHTYHVEESRLDLLSVLFIAVGLAMDAMAVSLGIGTTQYANTRRPIFRLSFHFGLFQFLFPVLGWLGGMPIQQYLGGIDHWVAFGLLSFVGARMVRSGFDTENETHKSDPSRGRMLVLLSTAVSIDAFAVGLSLAMLKVNVFYPAVIIGVVTGTLSLLGLRIGGRLGQAFGKRMEIIGGLILIAIGLRALL
jgi:manganese efflux pump family protein